MDINHYTAVDNNKEIQTNVFIKGMNTDTSDMLIGEDQYRYAENIRIVTDTASNTGEARIIEGNSLRLVLPNEEFNSGYSIHTILAANSIRNLAVFITEEREWVMGENNQTELHSLGWHIYTYNFDTEELKHIFGPCQTPIVDDYNSKHISTVLRWESDSNIKLYIADGIHELMSLSINEEVDSAVKEDFDKVFGNYNVVLPELTTTVDEGFGNIEGPVVQYAYRLYSENQDATRISGLSNPINVYNTSGAVTVGITPNKRSTQAVKIHFSAEDATIGTLDRMQIYRIAYVQIGQAPKVSLVYDGELIEEIVDRGGVQQTTISDADFVAMLKMAIVPKMIESKDNLLFAANVKYTQDDVDDIFKDFDARAYNKGMRINGHQKSILQEEYDGDISFDEVPKSGLVNDAYPNGDYTNYQPEQWEPFDNQNGFNGYGKCIGWKYNLIEFDINSGDKKKYYRRGEVYRFGIRLFDKKGRASSVKWIADIQFPTHERDAAEIFDNITFYPIGVYAGSPWDNVYAYEIVQCKRTSADKVRLFSGILGHVVQCDKIRATGDENNPYVLNEGVSNTNYIYPALYMSMMNISGVGGITYEQSRNFDVNFRYSYPNQHIFQYVFPEYVYQKDDVRNILSSGGYKLELTRTYKADGGEGGFSIKRGGYTEQNPVTDYIYRGRLVFKNDYKLVGEYSFIKNDEYFVYCGNERPPIVYNGSRIPFHTLGVISKGDGFEYHTNLITNIINYSDSIRYIYDDQDQQLPIHLFTWYGDRITPNVNRKIEKESSYFITYNKDDQGYCSHTASYVTNWNWNANYRLEKLDTTKQQKTISNIAFVDAPTDKDFATENGDFNFNLNLTAIDGKNFINWNNPYINQVLQEIPIGYSGRDWIIKAFFRESFTNEYDHRVVFNHDENDQYSQLMIAARSADTGSGGSCILVSLGQQETITEEDLFAQPPSFYEQYKRTCMPAITIADIINPSATPYGGFDELSLKNSSYISIGGYRKRPRNNNGEYIQWQSGNPSSQITVSGGDTFFQRFRYCSSHQWYDATLFNSSQPTILYDVYLESSIDLNSQYSNNLLGVTTWDYRAQEKATSFGGGEYVQQDDAYLYNTAYGAVADILTYTQSNTTKAQTNNYDVRIHHSQSKTNGEVVDSWKEFKSVNFLDVDTQYGQITALQVFKNKLIFWQEQATGVLSVNDRSIVQDVNKTHIVLGTGGILDRYDYFTTMFGQKPDQYNQTQSDSTLYWWDGYNKEILGYSEGYNVSSLSTVKNIKNYINKHEESTMPTLMYNRKYREVLCNVVDNQAVVYSEPLQAFTSVYTYCPVFYVDIRNKLFTAGVELDGETQLYEENTIEVADRSYLHGGSARPKIEYTVNKNPQATKTFDIQTFGGRFYGGAEEIDREFFKEYSNSLLAPIVFSYSTPLKQHSSVGGQEVITTREYDFRLNIPRDGIGIDTDFITKMKKSWGDRMRGKFMRCTIESTSNNLDFSLQYITTKFRTSWA